MTPIATEISKATAIQNGASSNGHVALLRVANDISLGIEQLTFALIAFTIAWFLIGALRSSADWASRRLRAKPQHEIRYRVLHTQLTLLRQLFTAAIAMVAEFRDFQCVHEASPGGRGRTSPGCRSGASACAAFWGDAAIGDDYGRYATCSAVVTFKIAKHPDRTSTKRSLVKAITYRVAIVCMDFGAIYVLTGKARVALGFMLVSNLYTTVGYFVHERIWARITWGRHTSRTEHGADNEYRNANRAPQSRRHPEASLRRGDRPREHRRNGDAALRRR